MKSPIYNLLFAAFLPARESVANAAAPVREADVANSADLPLEEIDGWFKIAPYGVFKGRIPGRPQYFGREQALAVEEEFNSVAGRLGLARIESARYEQPYQEGLPHDRVCEFNADMWTESFYSQPLTDYAVGFSDDADLDAELEFFAPAVPVSERFTYKVWDNAEEFLSETDDIRPPGSDFAEVRYTGSEVEGRVYNRGLQITVDYDQVRGQSNWEERYTAKLLRRIKRNELRRAITLLAAAATSTSKTWDVTSGKDPDMDVISELVTATDISGVRPNRVGYSDTAWTKRALAHRAQNSAGGFASAALTPQQVAGILGVDEVLVSKSRYCRSHCGRVACSSLGGYKVTTSLLPTSRQAP